MCTVSYAAVIFQAIRLLGGRYPLTTLFPSQGVLLQDIRAPFALDSIILNCDPCWLHKGVSGSCWG